MDLTLFRELSLLREHFDKLIVLFFACLILGVFLVVQANWPAAPALAWIEKSFDLVTGSFLALVSGNAVRSLATHILPPVPPKDPVEKAA